MGLTNKREELLKEMPAIKCSVSKSKDGKWVMHKTTITHIKPAKYYEAVLEGSGESLPEEELAALTA